MKIFSDKPTIEDNQIKFCVESQESFDVYEVVVKLKATQVFHAKVKLYFKLLFLQPRAKTNKKWYQKLTLTCSCKSFMFRPMPKNCKHLNYVVLTKFVVQSN